MTQKYKDPIIQKYFDLIEASFPEQFFKAYYQGEPTRIPASLLPCVSIAKNETRVGHLTNAEDEHGVQMILTVITDIRSELSTAEDDARIAAGIAHLYDIVEGRDSTTYKLKSQSILDILRKNQVVDAAYNLRTDLSTVTRVDYGETLRNRKPEEWTVEARVEFVAHFTQVR